MMKTNTRVVLHFSVFALLIIASLADQIGDPSPPEKAIKSPKDSIKRSSLPRNFPDGMKEDTIGKGALSSSMNGIHHSESSIRNKSLLATKILDDKMEGNMSKEVYDLWLRVIKSQRRNQLASAAESGSKRITTGYDQDLTKARVLIEEGPGKLSADLDDSKHGPRYPGSERSNCTHFDLGVCPPINS